jgi:hypothetical protein
MLSCGVSQLSSTLAFLQYEFHTAVDYSLEYWSSGSRLRPILEDLGIVVVFEPEPPEDVLCQRSAVSNACKVISGGQLNRTGTMDDPAPTKV